MTQNELNLRAVSDDELIEMNLSLQNERSEIRQRQLAVNAELTRRAAAADVRKKYNAMSDDEKAALRQVVSADAIPSEESFAD